jgi:predicted nucleotidyltransferase component of viral defense system
MIPKKNILTKQQQLFLNLFSRNKDLCKEFYLTGGTALAGFYIPYRLSQDLDFFSPKEVNTQPIITFIKPLLPELGFAEFDLNTSFNRNLVFLKNPKYILKLEFTYYPFTQINKPQKIKDVFIDSLEDIALNKLFTIYQKPRAQDFLDLYMICKEKKYSIPSLAKKAKIKFDWHIDFLKLGSQFLKAEKVKDIPKLLIPLKQQTWIDFYYQQAKKLKASILTK